MESKFFVDEYGREYISHDMVQNELGIKHMELERLLAILGCNWMFIHNFDGQTYFTHDYFEGTILNFFNHLKEKNALHRIQWKLPDKR